MTESRVHMLALAAALSSVGCDAGLTTIGWLALDAAAAGPDAAQSGDVYLEAESGDLSGGFRIEPDPVASARQYLAPPDDAHSDDAPGGARARYTFHVARAADYAIWGRIRSPDADTNRFWFQVDAGPWIKWRISVGDIWYWTPFHDDTAYDQPLSFALTEGEHSLLIANCVPGVGLDRLFVSAGPDAPSGNDTRCHPPHSIERDGQCVPSCGSQAGNACGPSVCAGLPILPAYDCDVCCRDPAKM